MIETDKIILAELIALLLKDGELPSHKEAQLKNLLQRYPEAKDSLSRRLSQTDIYPPFDLRNIDLSREWLVTQTKFTAKGTLLHPRKKYLFLNKAWSLAIAVAATVLLALTLLWQRQHREKSVSYLIPDKVYGHKNDVLPGRTGAILKIEGKEEIQLTEKKAVQYLAQGIELKEGRLIYPSNLTENLKNTLIVPKRSTMVLTFSDGTKVWVNAASEISYKTNFDKKERRVRLKGEAYFEVAKDAHRPFIVETNHINIQAIGTAFNVSSYHATTKVSLTEGKLKVSNEENEIYMDAGSETEIINKKLKTFPLASKAEATAFKDGYFYFKNKNMQQILDELSRWYGIQVDCKIPLNNERYEGSIKRDVTLGELCNLLKDLTGYKLTIDNDKLIVNR
ncbi:FecR family protein [Sphingobacterium sp. UBA5670]|uniref:FecR family protein n=1 Tax=Sphingobacterium sp. UBA5670 TaxID=1947502 RepID=UPI0025D83303|nr:FecR family protein [Sphingobacterium sp. UBA5670]